MNSSFEIYNRSQQLTSGDVLFWNFNLIKLELKGNTIVLALFRVNWEGMWRIGYILDWSSTTRSQTSLGSRFSHKLMSKKSHVSGISNLSSGLFSDGYGCGFKTPTEQIFPRPSTRKVSIFFQPE